MEAASLGPEAPEAYPFALDGSVFRFPAGGSGAAPREASLWFGRGVAWAHGFNMEEASRCFALALDSSGDDPLPLAHWGLALCHGPYYNRHGARYVKEGLNPEAPTFNIAKALAHAEDAARTLAPDSDPLVRALVEAMLVRCRAFASPLPSSSSPEARTLQTFFESGERAYANALRDVLRTFPDDPNVAALLAAAMMNTGPPWKLWLPTDATPREQRQPASDTLEIVRVLRHGLDVAPNHPGLCHLWVHAMEMAPDPSLALPQADILAAAGSSKESEIGHLCHMAAHIYMQLGDYQAAIATSVNACAADAKLIAAGQPYMGKTAAIYSGAVHNLHELLFACMWAGNARLARQALGELEKTAEKSGIERLPTRLEPFGLARFHFCVRFGLWDEILSIPLIPAGPDRLFRCTTWANQCYARGVAFAAKGNVAAAEAEQEAFLLARKAPLLRDEGMLSKRRLHNIPEQRKLDVAELLLAGEIAYRKGEYEEAFETLRRGVESDDTLPFDEPWGWMVPVRHALAALLAERAKDLSDKVKEKAEMLWREAAEVYRKDLTLHPRTVWALVGLKNVLPELGEGGGEEWSSVKSMLEEAHERTGVRPPTTSCACALSQWRGYDESDFAERGGPTCCRE